MATNRKVIITCASTGSIHTPTMSEYLPLTPKQIAEPVSYTHLTLPTICSV